MRINHNIPALNAYRNLNAATGANSKAMEKLSSGLRINRAADDAAGLAISETMRGQLKGLNQATRNSQDAISLIQTAEGALTETHSILDRMRELANQASNDTYTANDRQEMQKEINQLKDEIDRIGNTTTFNNKNLLDGSASAIVSADNANTQVFARGAITNSGAFKLTIEATAGKAQIQKTNVFKISEGDVTSNLTVAAATGISQLEAGGLQHDDYTVTTDAAQAAGGTGTGDAAVTAVQFYRQNAGAALNIFGADAGADLAVADVDGAKNLSFMAEITGINGNSITYKIEWSSMANDGTTNSGTTNWTLNDVTAGQTLTLDSVGITLGGGTAAGLTVGDKQTFALKADGDAAAHDAVTISGTATGTLANIVVAEGALDNKTSDFKVFSLDTTTGKSYAGTISTTIGGMGDGAATFTSEDGAGKTAALDTKLSSIDKFTDANGKFLLDQPQTLTLIQGDGKQTSVQLYASDTIQNVVDKLNQAIGEGLGQKDVLSNSADADKFVSFVTNPDSSGVESAESTIVIRSANAGADGKINIVGDEALISALGLSDVQGATESKFSVTVTDATNPSNMIAQNVSIQGNTLVGVVDKNVDVKFASNADIDTTYNATTKEFTMANKAGSYTTTINLVGNAQTFQIGANEAQNMTAAIGDMRSAALGVDNILVTDRDSASKAITIIDKAINQVSAQRSSLGAIQNRLEHTINNLGVATENMTASESRIRDVDMASEMMEFTKMNILTQASQAMLAQANQKPQAVLQLLQG
jgi:flagellin